MYTFYPEGNEQNINQPEYPVKIFNDCSSFILTIINQYTYWISLFFRNSNSNLIKNGIAYIFFCKSIFKGILFVEGTLYI